METLRLRLKSWIAHPGFVKYSKNTLWLFSGRLANMAISFIAMSYVIRNLGPEQYGLLSYVLSFAGLASVIANLGTDQIVSRDLARYPEKKDSLIGTALVIRFGGALAAFAIISGATFLIGNNLYTSLLILIVSASFFFSSFNIFNLYFQSQVKARYPSILSFFVVCILSILKIGFVYAEASLSLIVFVYFLEPILYAIGYLYFYIRHTGIKLSLKWDTGIAKSILHNSWPLIISGAFVAIYSRIDQVMIKSMIDETAVGLYDAGVRLAELWYFIPSLITVSFFPALINAQKSDSNLYLRRMSRLYFSFGLLALGVTGLVFILAPWIVYLLFGTQYAGTVPVLRLYVMGTLGVFLISPLYQHLINEGRTGILFLTSAFGAVTNIILNLLFIPKYGINGAALATFISYSLIPLSVLLFKDTRRHGIFMLQSIIKPL